MTITDVWPAKEVGERIAQELSDQGCHVTYAYCDVTEWESQVNAFKMAITFAPSKTLDVVAMFAGIGSEAHNLVDHVQAQEISLDKDPAQPSIRPLDINLIGVYYSSYIALHYFHLKPQEQGQPAHPNGDSETKTTKSLIFVSSLAGYIDYPGHFPIQCR